MTRPCDQPRNSKIGSIGSVEPVRSVTVKNELILKNTVTI